MYLVVHDYYLMIPEIKKGDEQPCTSRNSRLLRNDIGRQFATQLVQHSKGDAESSVKLLGEKNYDGVSLGPLACRKPVVPCGRFQVSYFMYVCIHPEEKREKVKINNAG